MKSFEVIPVLKSRCAKMEAHSNNMLKDFGVEEIHQFRLNFKKLNAFLHLLNADKKNDGKISPGKSLHAFYHATGQLRNLQLHSEKVLQMCHQLHLATPHNYLQELVQKQNLVKSEIREMARQKSLHRICHKLIARTRRRLSEDAVKKFVSENKRKLSTILLAENNTNKNLHSLRKLLKKFLYLWPWLEPEMSSLSLNICIDKGVCNTLCDMLGNFQNLCVTIELLDNYRSDNHATGHEDTILLLLRQQAQNERETLKQELMVELQHCLQKKWEKDVLLPSYL